MTIIIAIICLLVGCAIGYLATNSRNASLTTQARMQQERIEALRRRMQEHSDSIATLTEERTTLLAQRDVLDTQVSHLKTSMDELRQQNLETLRQTREQYEQRLQETREQYEQQMRQAEQRQRETEERQAQLIREQINTASENILKKRAEELSVNNQEQMANILTPLQENLRQMREAVERSDREHTTSMERLDSAIKANLLKAQEVGERADKLAQALTSENKTQGNFGELRLRTLLENMGFEQGVEFEEQSTLRDDEGKTLHDEEKGRRMIPDVILHFPDQRDVVIDSKMSLKAFEDYYQADTDDEREDALKRHLNSVRNHVKELAHKNYSRYLRPGHGKLDFVLMYVYSESALQLALSHDTTLWREAYEQGVIISGSQNLYMMLRVLEMTWRQVKQAENQEAIMTTANELVNRVQLFYERFVNADEQLHKTCEAFDSLKKTTSPSGQGIITTATRLLKYGAKENPKRRQRLPKEES